MESIKLKMPVTIKAKLTTKLQERIVSELTANIERAELEVQQINLEEERVIKEHNLSETNPADRGELAAIHQHFGEERQKRLEYRDQAMAKREETEKLAIGAEIVQGTLERQVEVHIGDNMRELMNVEVLVEDDKIVAIRS